MNLVEAPWIPVLWKDGATGLASLEEVFSQGGEILDLVALPYERIALMRLLICVGQAALDGPRNDAEWEKATGELPAAAADYLAKRQEDFNLFTDERPFLQAHPLEVPGGKSKTPKTPASKLELRLAMGG